MVEEATPEAERGDDKSDEGRLIVERAKLDEGKLEAEVVELFRELVIPRETDRLVTSGRAELKVVFGGRVELELPMSVVEKLLLPRKLVRVSKIPLDEDGGLVIVEDGGPEVEPEMTVVLSVEVVTETPEELEPRISLVVLPIKLVMGLRMPPLLELGDAGEDTGERVVGPSKEVVLPPEDEGETMVDDKGPDEELGKTVGVPVGVTVETLEVPGPKIALVTPPSKLVMGPIRPPPSLELGDGVTAGVECVGGLSREVVLPPEDGGETMVDDKGPDEEPGMTVGVSVGVTVETLEVPGPKIALVTPPSKLVMGPIRPPPSLELGDGVTAGVECVGGLSREVVVSPEDGGETVFGDEGLDVEPGLTIGVPVGVAVETLEVPGPKIALVTPPSKLVMGPIRPPPSLELGDGVTAGVECVGGLSREVVLSPEDGVEMMVGDEGLDVEPGLTIGVPVGVAVETSDVPGPKIALVTPPSKLVMGPIRPPPSLELVDGVTAGGDCVVGPLEEVGVASSEDDEVVCG